ncbi:MAG: DUF362 domain-containing protein [Chloroflexota bacterium]
MSPIHLDVSPRLSRRHLLRLAGSLALLAGCRGASKQAAAPSALPPTIAPTAAQATALPVTTSAPTVAPPTAAQPIVTAAVVPTAAPTTAPAAATSAPTAAPAAMAAPTRAEVTRGFPLGRSRVAQVHRAGAMSADLTTVSSEAVVAMLDAAMRQLTGLDDPAQAWRTLFDPDERVAIKVNTIAGSRYWTHPELVLAVTQRLQGAGVAAEQIVIFDRSTRELVRVFAENRNGPGVRCYGTDGRYQAGWTLMDRPVALSQILLDCDALINIPVLKVHGTSGISFAMKNHYGTFDIPGSFHEGRIGQAMAELNALEPIRARTRLIIGDALTACLRNWNAAVAGDRLLASFDPVAIDAVALQLFGQLAQANGSNPAAAKGRASEWLAHGQKLGVGAHELDKIELVEAELT